MKQNILLFSLLIFTISSCRIEHKEVEETYEDDIFSESPQHIEPVTAPNPVSEDAVPETGGLAAAIARSRIIKQEKEKTLRERTQAAPIKRI